MSQLTVDKPADLAPDKKAKKKHRGRRIILILIAVVLLLTVGTGVGYVGYLNHTLETQIKHAALMPPAKPGEHVPTRDPAAGKALNILLIGSDSRGAVANGRSDVMVLIHISSDRKKAHLVHFPRDLYVSIPGHGKDKINAAYAYGGPQLLVRTMQNLVDVPLDHVALIDFEGFKAMTDALGGVDVYAEEASTENSANGGPVHVGVNHFDGASALAFVRERKQLSEGDISRGRRQQAFIKALMVQVLSKDTMTNPVRFAQLVDAGSRNLTVDKDFSVSDMRSQAVELRDLRSRDIVFITAPFSGFGTSPHGASIDIVDTKRMSQLSAALRTDTMGDLDPGKQIP
jgi:LCP family protein required for cell wall assembly